MIPGIEKLKINERASLKQAMELINDNAQGICFLVNDSDVLKAVLTDGDIRRALLAGSALTTEIRSIAKTDFVSFPVNTAQSEISRHLSATIRHIPLVDGDGRLVDYASFTRYHRIPVMTPSLNGNELNYVMDCIQTGWISSQGTYVSRFEKEFATFSQSNHAVAVSNGTVAIHLALAALGIGEGDEVIVPDLTFAASINAVIYTGATPVLVDVDMDTFCMDMDALRAAIGPKTRAIMPVHLYGHPCEMDTIIQLAKAHNLLVVEDCAEAIGSTYKGKHVGSFSDAATFSFFGNKTITTGEGGMVVFRNQEHADHARVLRDHGMNKQKRYWHDYVGFNYRMTNLQAAIGVAQMERVEEFVQAKKQLAKTYNSILSSNPRLQLPVEKEDCISGFWLYTLFLKNASAEERDALIARLLMNGIETRPVFYPLHQMPPYVAYAQGKTFPKSDLISNCGISLPSSVSLTEKELKVIAKTVLDLTSVKQLL